MVKQFLLNADGSVPAGTNIQMLQEAGVVFVMPTTPPKTTSGYAAQDIDPELVDGIWYQRWQVIEHPDVTNPPATNTPDITQILGTLTQDQLIALSTVIQSLGNNNGN